MLLIPRDRVPADEGAPQRHECLVDVCTPLIADLESPKAIEPRECSLHHPAMSSKPLARLDAAPRNARGDTARAQCPTAACVIIPLIGMQLHGPLAWPSTSLSSQSQRRDGVNSFFEPLRIVDIGPRNGHRQGHTVTVNHDMALRPQLVTTGRILASRVAPLEPGTGAIGRRLCPVDAPRISQPLEKCSRSVRGVFDASASTHLLDASSANAASRSSRSCGSLSHGTPLFKRQTMPVSAAQSVTPRGRPPLGLGDSEGN